MAAESIIAFSKQFILSCSDRSVSLFNLAEKIDQNSLHSRMSPANLGRSSLRLLYLGDWGVTGVSEREGSPDALVTLTVKSAEALSSSCFIRQSTLGTRSWMSPGRMSPRELQESGVGKLEFLIRSTAGSSI